MQQMLTLVQHNSPMKRSLSNNMSRLVRQLNNIVNSVVQTNGSVSKMTSAKVVPWYKKYSYTNTHVWNKGHLWYYFAFNSSYVFEINTLEHISHQNNRPKVNVTETRHIKHVKITHISWNKHIDDSFWGICYSRDMFRLARYDIWTLGTCT